METDASVPSHKPVRGVTSDYRYSFYAYITRVIYVLIYVMSYEQMYKHFIHLEKKGYYFCNNYYILGHFHGVLLYFFLQDIILISSMSRMCL